MFPNVMISTTPSTSSSLPKKKKEEVPYFTPENIRLSTPQALLRYMFSHLYEENNELLPIFWGMCNFNAHKALSDSVQIHKKTLSILPEMDEKTLTDCCLSFSEAKMRKQTLVINCQLFPTMYKLLPLLHLASSRHLPLLVIATYSDNFRETSSPKVVQQVESSLQSLQSLCHFTGLINNSEDLIKNTDLCVDSLMKDPGPTCLLISEKMLHNFSDYTPETFQKKKHQLSLPQVDDDQINQLVQAIESSKKPVCILGGGALSSDYSLLSKLLKHCHIPVCETSSGKGSLSFDFPLHLGSLVNKHQCLAKQVISESDCVICLGTFLEDYSHQNLFHQQKANIFFVNLFMQEKEMKLDTRFRYIKCHINTLAQKVLLTPPMLDKAKSPYLAKISEFIDNKKKEYIQSTFNSGEIPTIPQVTACLNRSIRSKDLTIYGSEDCSEETYLFWRSSHHRSFPLIQDLKTDDFSLHKGLGYRLAFPKQSLYLILTANDLPKIQNILFAYQTLNLKFNLIILDHPSEKKKQAIYSHHLNDYLKSLDLNPHNCKDLGDLEASIKLKRKQNKSLFAVIKTDIFTYNPNLSLWRSSMEKRLGLSKSKSISYGSEEQTWHVRFPWENKNNKESVQNLTHSLD
jgi:3D-(3,5/4)-trihydroxycyclohexane-1,2-dione acylhydrolase (decyclizing)